MDIKALMLFESTVKINQTNAQGQVREIDAFIAPTTNFIVPYLPWPLTLTILVMAEGAVGKQQFQLNLFKKNSSTNLAKVEGELNVNSTGIVPEENLSVSFPFTLNQVVFKEEGEYTLKVKLGILAWREMDFHVYLQKEEFSGT